MTEQKISMERTYVIPLRRQWMKVPSYKRTRKCIVAIKEFIARHMKVPDHDVSKVKVDVYLNNEVWHRGSTNAPARVTVKAHKVGDIVHVRFAETPKSVAFAQAKHAKLHSKPEKKAPKVEEKTQDLSEEQKKDEAEKEKSVAIANEKMAEQEVKAVKHTTKAKTPEIRRMALKK